MNIRELKANDAPLMLEWMHDESVVHDLKTDFSKKTIIDCIHFIESALDDPNNVHMAITDDDDTYMGTVSLKHIENGRAEFGITIRRCAMGKGFSRFGMNEIIEIGFKEFHLHQIYWCVDPNNIRALKFYNKNGFKQINTIERAVGYTKEEISKFVWYSIEKDD